MKKILVATVIMFLVACDSNDSNNAEIEIEVNNLQSKLPEEVDLDDLVINNRTLFITDLRNIGQIVTDIFDDIDVYDGNQEIHLYKEIMVLASSRFIIENYEMSIDEYSVATSLNETGQITTYIRFEYSSEARDFLMNSDPAWRNAPSKSNILSYMKKSGVLIISNSIDNQIRQSLLTNKDYDIEVVSFFDTFRMFSAERIIVVDHSQSINLDPFEIIEDVESIGDFALKKVTTAEGLSLDYLAVPSSVVASRIYSNINELLSVSPLNLDLIISLGTIQLTPLEDSSSDITICQLKTNETHNDGSQLGFPYVEPFIPNQGVVNVLVAPIDFPNYRGDINYLNGLTEDVSTITKWADFFSGGNMSYNLIVLEDWTMYPKGEDYLPTYGSAFENSLQDPRITKTEIVELLSQKVDISEIDMFYFIFPTELLVERKVVIYGKDMLRLGDGTLITAAFYGNERYENVVGTYWNHLLHETLHFQGFVGHGPGRNWDSSYSVMNNGDQGAVGIMSWEAFLIGWFDEEDIHCISKENLTNPVTLKIGSIDQLGANGGIKSIMIPLSDEKILIIEYRTEGLFSRLRNDRIGIISYVVDISRKSLYPNGPSDQFELDKVNFWYHLYPNPNDLNPVFSIGTFLEYEGIRVDVVDEGTVQISELK